MDTGTGLYHPRPRQPSTSTFLTSSTSAEGSGSGGSTGWMPQTRASTSTSVWSDEDEDRYTQDQEGTVVGGGFESWKDDTAPLIDLDDLDAGAPHTESLSDSRRSQSGLPYEGDQRAGSGDEDEDGHGHGHGARSETAAQVLAMPTPGEKLRMLLKQMEAEVRETIPPPPPRPEVPTKRVGSPAPRQAYWREGRRIGALPKERPLSPGRSPPRRPPEPSRRTGEGDAHEGEAADDDGEESPPTPPLRITNPYLSRKVSSERRETTSTPPVQRISSRAAVLHASTSRSISPPAEHAAPIPTPLQSYLNRSTSPSRKGKERAASLHGSSPARAPRQSLPTRTPRKWSVELAPDDSALFAEEAMALEVEGEVELDLEEDASRLQWADESEDEVEGVPARGSTIEPEPVSSPSSSSSSGRRKGTSSQAIPVSPAKSRTRIHTSSSPSTRKAEPDDSLPPLPEPEADISSDDDLLLPKTYTRPTPSFHSSPKIARGSSSPSTLISRDMDRSRSAHSLSIQRLRDTSLPFPQEPIRVGMALTSTSTSTPTKSAIPRNLPPSSAGQTPKPPGAWLSAKKQSPQSSAVRFSPLRQEQNLNESEGDISIHRIRLSPHKSSTPTRIRNSKNDNTHTGEAVGDTSFTRRLLNLTRRGPLPLPKPSTTLNEARVTLEKAAETSAAAQRKVEITQRAWMDALSAASMGAEVVIKQSWGWGRWAWWVGVELLLVWGVFRVTLDYASSIYTDPLATQLNSLALAIPVPSALSTFVIPSSHRRGSANFFDLIEQAELWRYLHPAGVGVGIRTVPGTWVPT